MAVDQGQAAFQAFLAGVLGKIADPAQRQSVETAFASLTTVEPVARALYDGVAGQSAISTQMAELATSRQTLETQQTELDQREARLETWHQNLTEWYEEKKTLLEDAARGRKPNGHTPTPTPTPTPAPAVVPEGVLTQEQAREALQAQNAAFLGFQRDQNQLLRDHYAKFHEILDLEPLLLHPQVGQIGLKGVYEIVHKDRLTQHQTDAEKAREESIRADERQKVQAAQAQMPYPSPTGVGSGSPLDALAVGKPDALVDQATAHYHRLVSERMAGGAPR